VLEAVGQSPRGLSVKQIARRCELTTATTYHLVRTLAYERYVIRREDGTYITGLEIADRYRELVAAFQGPATAEELLRKTAAETGYSHYLGSFIGGQVVVTTVAEGPLSPRVEDLVVGFDDGAHATAMGKALLSTLSQDQRWRYLKDWGMRTYTAGTLTQPEALDVDLVNGERRGMHIELAQFRPGLGCAAVHVRSGPDPERRIVVACAMPVTKLADSASTVRTRLQTAARGLAPLLGEPTAA
jgi:DNA-binding IclR family transcriptional regulator